MAGESCRYGWRYGVSGEASQAFWAREARDGMSEGRRGRMRNWVWGSGFGRAGEREVGELMVFEATDIVETFYIGDMFEFRAKSVRYIQRNG